jgi:hypothetical protein
MSGSDHRHDLEQQAGNEVNAARLMLIIAQLCEAIDFEREGETRPMVTDLRFPSRDPGALVEN